MKYSVLARDQETARGNCFLKNSDLISIAFHIFKFWRMYYHKYTRVCESICMNCTASIWVLFQNCCWEKSGLLSSVLSVVARHKSIKKDDLRLGNGE